MISKTLFFAFVCVTLGKCDSLTKTAGKDSLQYLNSNSEQTYSYRSIKSLDILNKMPNGKETTFNCGNKQEEKFKSKRSRVGRSYDQDDFDDHIREKRQLIGGPTEVNVDDPTIVELAHNSTVLLDRSSEHDNKYKVIHIKSATKAIVAGVLYNLEVTLALSDCAKTDTKLARDCGKLKESAEENCRIKIWDRSWLPNGTETTFNCGNKQEQTFQSKRRRRSVGRIYDQDNFDDHTIEKRQAVGGITEVNVDDPTIVELAQKSAVLLDGSSEHDNKYKVINIKSATKQIVAGFLYNLEVTLALSDCAKTDTKLARDCDKLKESAEENCRIKIWERSWLPNGTETTFNCGNKQEQTFQSKRRRRSAGRIYDQDVSTNTEE